MSKNVAVKQIDAAEPTDRIGATTPTRLARAVIYLRVSTKDQAERGGEAEGFSIPAQREACIRKAASLGAEVVDEFIDAGESAKTSQRPALKAMLASIDAHHVQYVIVHKVDRLARNRLDDALITMEIGKAGASLVSCTENIDETPSGVLMHGIMSSISEFYSRNLANEVIKGSVQKAKSGGTIGRAPTGYRNVRHYENGVENRTVEVDPERGPLMTWAFEAYATGEWTIRKLLDELTARGLTSSPTKSSPAKPLVPSNFHRLLCHPYYKGIVRYKGVEYPGRHEPLVSVDTWDRVQAVLRAQNYAGEKNRDHPHYLRGTVFCGQCGSRLVVTHAKGRRGRVYEYYMCVGRQQKRTQCLQKVILIEQLAAAVEEHYLMVQPSEELLGQIRIVLDEELRQAQAFSGKERDSQERRVRKLEDERTKLLDGYYAGAIPMDLMKREQTRLTSELSAATGRLAALVAEFDVVRVNLDQAIELAGNWHAAYMRATDSERRMLNLAIFEALYIDEEGSVVHEFADPFDLLLGRSVVTSIFDRIDRQELSPEKSAAIDDAWSAISARWAAEEVSRRTRASNPKLKTNAQNSETPDGIAATGGLNVTLLVGVEGLEPPTSAM
jgi:site-specific DNA recombinase